MAPRTAKAKKTGDVKVTDNEVPKKGRGKAKTVEDPEPEVADADVIEEVAPTDKKSKRGKKVANGQDIEQVEDAVPPAKKGKKKAVEEGNGDDKPSNGDNSGDDESTPSEQNLPNGESSETNGEAEEAQNGSAGKGRKKPTKKETETKAKQSGRGKKNAKPVESAEAEEESEVVADDKPKSAAKGRGRKAAAKPEPEAQDKSEDHEEESKPEPAPAKGRKKAQPKAVKEKSPESEKDPEDEKVEDDQPEEPKKKESKGRKNLGKKVQAKEESAEKDEEVKEEPPAKKRKGAKKDDKAKGDVKDEEVMEATDEVVEDKPAKGKRGQKKAAEPLPEAEDEPQDTGEQPTKRRRKQAEEKAPAAKKEKAPLKNKALTDYGELDFSNSSKNAQGKEWNFKISSWNVDGIRAWMNKGGLDYLKHEKPDILCLQEVKCAQDKLPEEIANVPGYHAYWLCSDKDGYAGVGIYTTKLAMNVQYGLQNEELDSEGRIITAEYEHFYLITTYVPNAGKKLVTLPKRLQWNEEFRKFVKALDEKKPVIICGDMNVAHNEIDLANPKTNRKNAGFTDEERSGMSELLGDGYVDTFRHLYPDKTGAYTFWTYMMNSRSKNVGWRLDYFIVSERLLPTLCDSVIRDGVFGSDHCPLTLFLHLSSADKPK